MKDIRYSSNIMANKTWILFCISSILFASYGTEAFIGMTWGRQSAQRLVPSQAVDLLLQNGIQHARIYTSELDLLKAFVNSGIELTITLASENFFLEMGFSRKWVQKRADFLVASNVKHITIGRYVFHEGLNDRSIIKRAMTSMTNLQRALDEVGNGQITTNMVHILEMLKPNISRPSEAEFRDEIIDDVREYVQILKARGSCGQLTFEQNVSYAFNMRFQFVFQNESECDFGGLGKLSVEDPSVGECVFPIEVVKGEQKNLVTVY